MKGITAPRSDYFSIEGATFHNFDGSSLSSSIFTGNHKNSYGVGDSARTTWVKELRFGNNVPRRLLFKSPFNDIVVDVDGSLSGNGIPMSTIVRYG